MNMGKIELGLKAGHVEEVVQLVQNLVPLHLGYETNKPPYFQRNSVRVPLYRGQDTGHAFICDYFVSVETPDPKSQRDVNLFNALATRLRAIKANEDDARAPLSREVTDAWLNNDPRYLEMIRRT